MSEFSKLSREPGSSIDPETGEVQINRLFQSLGNTFGKKAGKYIEPSFPQQTIDIARASTSSLCESVLSHITGGKKVKRGNNKGFDILLPNNARLEAKMGRIGNSAVIKKSQLIFLGETGYYGVLYYRTTKNSPPSSFIELSDISSSVENLMKNISLEAAFIIPQPAIVYYYNTQAVNEGRISTTGTLHKPLAYRNAQQLFQENYGEYETCKQDASYEDFSFPVFSLGYSFT